MANPFLDFQHLSTPNSVSDPVGDDSWYDTTPYHVAAMLLVALLILTVLKVSGLRAMVGIGRG